MGSSSTPLTPLTPLSSIDQDDGHAQQSFQECAAEPQPNSYFILPPNDVANTQIDVDKFIAFIDLWDREQDYSGELYDILDDKVRAMLSLCNTLRIEASQIHVIFGRILTGPAEYHYRYHVHHDDTFATAYKKIKDRFYDAVNHSIYYTDWTTITFESTRKEYRAKHPGPEDLPKVLEAMLDKLQLCQRALGPHYASDIHLRDTVLRACRGVPALSHASYHAFCNPLQSRQEMFSHLRRSLRVHLDCHPARPQPGRMGRQ